MSEFGYTYFIEICSPISMFYLEIVITQFGCVMTKLWPKYSHRIEGKN